MIIYNTMDPNQAQFIEYPVLYKYTNTGAIQQWQIIVKGNTFYTVEGHKDGKLTESLPTICHGKNQGKKNETSDEQQAISKAESRLKKKRDKGYNEVLLEDKLFFEPMLAFELKKYEHLLFTVDTYVQPKLDGIRCVNEGGTLMSRNGKPFISCPHLTQGEVTLDGELYNHKFKEDFNAIVSLVTRKNLKEDDLEKTKELVEFHCYDFPKFEGVFSKRYSALVKWVMSQNALAIQKGFKSPYILVPTFKIGDMKDLKHYHEMFLDMGFEGTIIRMDLGNYENKRSKQLLKYKDFIDDEYLITGAIEGEGGRTGTIGKFVMQTKDGKVFNSNIKGDFKYLREVWNEREFYIGTKATVKFFQLTPDGIPRFPYIIKLNREIYE